MTNLDDPLLHANAAYAAAFAHGSLPAAPARRLAIVACMDARLDVHAALGLKPGEAHVIRNAGGVVTDDVIRSLAISQRKLGTEEIVLVHHTQCGMETFTDDDFSNEIERDTGLRPGWSPESFTDAEQDVRDSIARLEASPFIPHKQAIRGFVYEVETGRLREIK